MIGQLVYLAASLSGIGVTAVGGFANQMWREISRLPDGDDVVYVLALGVDQDGERPKTDRQEGAHAHGE